eukprot:8066616-Alexandrium_andersonii.AAC.1
MNSSREGTSLKDAGLLTRLAVSIQQCIQLLPTVTPPSPHPAHLKGPSQQDRSRRVWVAHAPALEGEALGTHGGHAWRDGSFEGGTELRNHIARARRRLTAVQPLWAGLGVEQSTLHGAATGQTPDVPGNAGGPGSPSADDACSGQLPKINLGT